MQFDVEKFGEGGVVIYKGIYRDKTFCRPGDVVGIPGSRCIAGLFCYSRAAQLCAL
jgi:hypothetical protein